MDRRINMWSGPRNLSTALMYSWRQRADTTVVDEPLYAAYLRQTQRSHPDADVVMMSQPTDAAVVVDHMLTGSFPTPVVFFKQMSKHLAGVDRSFLAAMDNVLLTRDPLDQLASFAAVVPDVRIADTGLPELVELAHWMVDEGLTPIVLDSMQLRRRPEAMLTALCDRLGLRFDPAMLSWPAGPKPEDGVWAPHWYEGVWRSTGFEPPAAQGRPLPAGLDEVLAEARSLHSQLQEWVIDP